MPLTNITRFGDVKFDPELFMDYIMEESPHPSAFIQSGIFRQDPAIASALANEGNLLSVPFFKPLTGSSQNRDGSDILVNPVESGLQTAIVIGRQNAWGADDMSAELATKDPMRAIAAKVSTYWREEKQRILLSQLNGVFAAPTLAGHVYDVAVEDGDNATDSNKVGADTLIDAAQAVLGDNASKIVAICVHSKVFARLQKLNLIEYVALSEQSTRVPFFLDKQVIVDDTMPVVAGGTSGFKYTTYLFAKSTIGLAEVRVKVPVELERDGLKGGGMEWLIHRNRFVYHPYGTRFTSAALAKISPTDAELATGSNYELVYDRKNFAIAKLLTNG